MDGADVIIFTGGIGENSTRVRKQSASPLEFLGIELDKERNENLEKGEEGRISRDSSRVEVYVIPTNEELTIAWDTFRCIEDAGK